MGECALTIIPTRVHERDSYAVWRVACGVWRMEYGGVRTDQNTNVVKFYSPLDGGRLVDGDSLAVRVRVPEVCLGLDVTQSTG